MLGSSCGSVGRVVTSNTRGPRFKSSHRQKIILNIYYQLYWKDENKEKEAGKGPFIKKCLCDPFLPFLVFVRRPKTIGSTTWVVVVVPLLVAFFCCNSVRLQLEQNRILSTIRFWSNLKLSFRKTMAVNDDLFQHFLCT